MKHAITHININGIRTNTQEKQAFLQKSLIISLQDTRLKPTQNNLEQLFPQYTIHETKHANHTAGIAILIHNTIKHEHISTIIQNGNSLITVKITDKKFYPHPLHISSFHAPPGNSRYGTRPFNIQLLQKSLSYTHAITLGDLNAKHTLLGCKATNKHGKHLLDYLNNSTHIILNDTTQPTFTHTAINQSDTLDYVISTQNIAAHTSDCHTREDIGSDHLPLTLNFKHTKQDKVTQRSNTYNIKLTNWPMFTETLQKHITQDPGLWPPKQLTTPTQLDTHVKLLINHYQSSIENATPQHRTPNIDKPRLPPHILLLIQSRRHLRYLQLQQPNTHQRKQINQLNKNIKKAIKQLKTNIATQKANILKQGTKHPKFWPTVKALLKPTQHHTCPLTHNNTQITDPKQKADIFQQHFEDIFTSTDSTDFNEKFKQKISAKLPNLTHLRSTHEFQDTHTLTKPITYAELIHNFKKLNKNKAPGPDNISYEHIKEAPHSATIILLNIYNAIIQTAYIPPQFKQATITVIPKPNKDLTQATSYRPITLASTLSKTFERIINTRLLTHVLQNKILHEQQTAFLPNKDTTDNILHTVQTITNNYNRNKYTLLFSLDIKQAFDRSWHHGIIHTLLPHTSTHFCKILYSFLTQRTIYTKHENMLAQKTFSPTQGVPQGSPLSPLLFNTLLSTAPFPQTQDVNTYNYADDTFFTSTAGTPTQAWTQLQPHITNFMSWCQNYRLHIQTQKTSVTFYTRRRSTTNIQYPDIIVNNTTIERQNTTTILGTTLDTHLTLKEHIKKINSKTHYTINQIRKIQSTNRQIPPSVALLLYKTLLRTKFTYATPLLTLIKSRTWRPLQITEHRALRAAHRKGIRTRLTYLYKISNMQPIYEHYINTSKQTLNRIITNKNKRLLLTMFNTQPHRHKTFTVPPLDFTLKQFTDQEQQNLQQSIQNIISSS